SRVRPDSSSMTLALTPARSYARSIVSRSSSESADLTGRPDAVAERVDVRLERAVGVGRHRSGRLDREHARRLARRKNDRLRVRGVQGELPVARIDLAVLHLRQE